MPDFSLNAPFINLGRSLKDYTFQDLFLNASLNQKMEVYIAQFVRLINLISKVLDGCNTNQM